jgi:hypothetical protein
MIREKTKRFYYLICDGCGASAPGSPLKEEAINQAIEAGWQRHHKWNGLAYIHRDYCPNCAKEKGD